MKQDNKGLPKRVFTQRGRCSRFFTTEAVEKSKGKKLRQILKSSGAKQARKWAEKMDAISCLRDISQESGKIGKLAKQAFK